MLFREFRRCENKTGMIDVHRECDVRAFDKLIPALFDASVEVRITDYSYKVAVGCLKQSVDRPMTTLNLRGVIVVGKFV